MLREIKRIIPLSAAKLAAVIYGAMGVVVGFPIALATVLPSIIHGREAGTSLSLPMITVIVLAILIIVPLFYALLGFIIGGRRRSDLQFVRQMARRIASRS